MEFGQVLGFFALLLFSKSAVAHAAAPNCQDPPVTGLTIAGFIEKSSSSRDSYGWVGM